MKSRLCAVTSESGRIGKFVNKSAASFIRYESRYLKRSGEPNVNDPCDGCLITSACVDWCDEKRNYLWE